MLTLNFYSFKEKKPSNGQEIIYLRDCSDIYGEAWALSYCDAEYVWDDGNGTSWPYADGDTAENSDAELIILNEKG